MPYTWPADKGTHGVTTSLRHQKVTVAKAGSGTHCVGFTFQVMWQVAASRKLLRSLSLKQVRKLRRQWFVPAAGGKGAAQALPAAGIGTAVSMDRARPGDFVQMWNDDLSFGHSAVFLGWKRDKYNQPIEIRYISSQPWTDGIGVSSFSIGKTGMSKFYFGRLKKSEVGRFNQ